NDCTQVSGVVNFVDWVNEIHRWGLTIHGPACELDIKISISKASKGIRNSLGTDLDRDLVVEDIGNEDAVLPSECQNAE
ncbi:MAG: hypothetical protein MMC33_009379, partial [Icmadophila ericetorum]|nr:hypothetical protein [Icmadophila ericetorum]